MVFTVLKQLKCQQQTSGLWNCVLGIQVKGPSTSTGFAHRRPKVASCYHMVPEHYGNYISTPLIMSSCPRTWYIVVYTYKEIILHYYKKSKLALCTTWWTWLEKRFLNKSEIRCLISISLYALSFICDLWRNKARLETMSNRHKPLDFDLENSDHPGGCGGLKRSVACVGEIVALWQWVWHHKLYP